MFGHFKTLCMKALNYCFWKIYDKKKFWENSNVRLKQENEQRKKKDFKISF